jgi:predicted TIM-barrel fold metal-dependent hydrolase
MHKEKMTLKNTGFIVCTPTSERKNIKLKTSTGRPALNRQVGLFFLHKITCHGRQTQSDIREEDSMKTRIIIDAHAHIFPDKIANKAVKAIGEYYSIPMQASGTVGELLERGASIGVEKYIIHSTATTVAQVTAINDYIAATVVQNSCFIGFGTLHPCLGEAGLAAELDRVISLGLKGIKLHPEFQGFAIDDAEMMPLYKTVEGKLPILMHMGDENKDSSHPSKLAAVLDRFPRLTVIAAHLGGYQMWDEAIRSLNGRTIYVDTSSALFALEPSEAARIIRSYGIERVLFGTDYPMWDHMEEFDRFMKLDLTDEEREAILWKNAARLLGIEAELGKDC